MGTWLLPFSFGRGAGLGGGDPNKLPGLTHTDAWWESLSLEPETGAINLQTDLVAGSGCPFLTR